MIRIGKIVATHGVNGSLILSHFVGNSGWLKKGQVLHIEMQKGSFIPYFVSQARAQTDSEYIVNIEDIDKVESAKKLITRQVYVDESILSGLSSTSPLLWIGFNLIDEEKGDLGAIEDVFQTGSQWLAKITYRHKEVLAPLIPETIIRLDIKSKAIYMKLPNGLIEMYLSI